MKNQHLNLFRFFNESSTNEAIENNLSRALAIVLQNNALFFNDFVKTIVSPDDYEYLFSYWERQKSNKEGEETFIDIQVSDDNIDKEQYKTVYPVAVTTDQNMNLDGFSALQNNKENNIRDITLSIKDILIVIEVKRSGENCKEQLFSQIAMFMPQKQEEDNKSNNVTVKGPQNFSWQSIIKILEKTNNLQHSFSKNDVFTNDFLDLLLIHYPNWFGAKPFAVLPNNSPLEFFQNRLLEALNILKEVHSYSLTPEGWRIRVGIPMKWASEVVIVFNNATKGFEFQVYPGNTKEQGKSLFAKNLGWTNQTALQVKNYSFDMYVDHNIKFSHFNSYITAIEYPISTQLKKVLYIRLITFGIYQVNGINLNGKTLRILWTTILTKYVTGGMIVAGKIIL